MGGALAEIVAVETAARRPRGQPRRVPVAAVVVPAVVEPVIAAGVIVAVDRADIQPAQQPAQICDVCIVNPKNKVFVPFGHTVCHECAEKLERLAHDAVNPCFYCRTQVAQIHNYFPRIFFIIIFTFYQYDLIRFLSDISNVI